MKVTAQRYSFLFVLMLLLLLPVVGGAVKPNYDESEESILKSRSSYTTTLSVNNRSLTYFAQNSPEWSDLRVSDESWRTMGESECSVLALANTLVNVLEPDQIPAILDLAKKPVMVDTKQAGYKGGYSKEYKFVIGTPDDIIRFLPLVIANITSGNNTFGFQDSFIVSSYKKFFKHFDLEYSLTSESAVCYDALAKGAMVIVCSGGSDSPIGPKFGHYFVLAGIDDEYVYCLDSIYRNKYPDDRKNVIELIQPGLFRYRIDNSRQMQMHGTKYIVYPARNKR